MWELIKRERMAVFKPQCYDPVDAHSNPMPSTRM